MTVYPYHDFRENLRKSEAPRQYIKYMTAVDHWWGDEVDWNRVKDLDQQKQGNDMTITLKNGRTLHLQFKYREKDYGDILIEYRHDYLAGFSKPGWIEQPSEADYLIYVTPKTIYRIPYPKLHAFWKNRKVILLRDYPTKIAYNRDYVTLNLPVTPALLREAGVQVDQLAISKENF